MISAVGKKKKKKAINSFFPVPPILSIELVPPQRAHLSVLVIGFSLIQLPGNLGQGISFLNEKNRHLLVQECTAGYPVAVLNHYPFGIFFFLGMYAVKNRNCLCCFYKRDKSNLATDNYFIPKSMMCVATYP